MRYDHQNALKSAEKDRSAIMKLPFGAAAEFASSTSCLQASLALARHLASGAGPLALNEGLDDPEADDFHVSVWHVPV